MLDMHVASSSCCLSETGQYPVRPDKEIPRGHSAAAPTLEVEFSHAWDQRWRIGPPYRRYGMLLSTGGSGSPGQLRWRSRAYQVCGDALLLWLVTCNIL